MGANVFFSYTRADAGLAKEIADQLRAHGVTAPLLADAVKPGDAWAEWLRSALEASDAVVLLLSDASFNSPDVMGELGAAWALGKRILALRSGNGPMPLSLREMRVLDIAGMPPDEIAAAIQNALTE
jgi:hypothetical protein